MTERCADLDEFFDGELAADQADAFRDHLATCERCERVLEGRMQESIAVRVPAVRLEQPAAAPVPAVRLEQPGAAPVLAARTTAREAVAPAPAMPPAAAVPIDPRRARGCGRFFTYAAPILAAAAAIPLWLAYRGDPDLELSLAVDRAPVIDRTRADRDRADMPPHGLIAHIGDTLRPRAHGARHRAIGVYLGERLIAACPGDARCSDGSGDLVLDLPLTDHGRYTILALGSSDPLPAPGPTLDPTRAAARRAGIRTELQYVEIQ
jgi:hypothetical protein